MGASAGGQVRLILVQASGQGYSGAGIRVASRHQHLFTVCPRNLANHCVLRAASALCSLHHAHCCCRVVLAAEALSPYATVVTQLALKRLPVTAKATAAAGVAEAGVVKAGAAGEPGLAAETRGPLVSGRVSEITASPAQDALGQSRVTAQSPHGASEMHSAAAAAGTGAATAAAAASVPPEAAAAAAVPYDTRWHDALAVVEAVRALTAAGKAPAAADLLDQVEPLLASTSGWADGNGGSDLGVGLGSASPACTQGGVSTVQLSVDAEGNGAAEAAGAGAGVVRCDCSDRLRLMLLLARTELAAAVHHHCGSTTAEQALRLYQQFVEGIQGNASDKNICSEGKRVSIKEGGGACSDLVAGGLQQRDWPLGMECAEAHVALGSLLLQQAGDTVTLLSSGGNGSGSSGNGSGGNTLSGKDGVAGDACDSQKTADGATSSAATLDVVQATAAETTKQAQADATANVVSDTTAAAAGVTEATVTMAGGEALKHYRSAASILQCLESHPRSHTLFIQALAGASRCHTFLGQYAAAKALAVEGLLLCAGRPPALNHATGPGAKHRAAVAAAVPQGSSCVGSSCNGAACVCEGSSSGGGGGSKCGGWGGWG